MTAQAATTPPYSDRRSLAGLWPIVNPGSTRPRPPSRGSNGIGKTVNAAQRASNQILLIAVILVGLGVVMVYSSSSVLAGTRYADSSFFLVRQVIRAAIGLGIMFILSRLPLRIWQRAARPMILTGLALLVLVLIFGQGKGASRWLPFPFPWTG